jgi:phosphoribosyl-ATP pyrophosphohydrolase/phosphoribosyl-AMP cyclohydrolase/histidinol dehydrogenase
MSSFPYPAFLHHRPVDAAAQRAALAAVGRCRIVPTSSYPGAADFREIVQMNVAQAHVGLTDETDGADPETLQTTRKARMKQGIAMAKTYFVETLQLDVTVVDVEVVLDARDVIQSDGCLASGLLDAGCDKIVVDGTNRDALETAQIPKARLMGHFVYPHTDSRTRNGSLAVAFAEVQPFCDSVSVELSNPEAVTESVIQEIVQAAKAQQLQISIVYNPNDYENPGDHAAMVGRVCQSFPEGQVRLALTDPTASQLGHAYAACLKTDRDDGLFATVVCTRNNEALGLVYSSTSSIVAALECGRGVYYSRSRNGLWRKGDTSGHFQVLHRLDKDCDGDALRVTVTQKGTPAAFCHLNTLTCWGTSRGLRHLEETLQDRLVSAPEGSYTKRLFQDETLLRDKLVEEAQELSEADTKAHVAEELADVLYFAMVRAVKAGVSLDDAVAELDSRARKVTRRKGDSKAFRIAAGEAILKKAQS